MKQLAIFATITFTIALSLPGNVLGKCAAHPYKIIGAVRDESSKKAIADATLFFFLDNYGSTWSNGYKTSYPDFFRTNDKGEFTAFAWFDTFKGYNFFTGHNCNGKPSNLTIVITVQGYLTKRIQLTKKQLVITEGETESIIRVGQIELKSSS